MKNTIRRWVALFGLVGAIAAAPSGAQTSLATFQEDFTGTATTNTWYYFGGACLTAGTSSAGTSPGLIPSCTSVLASYYSHASSGDQYLVGGNSGYLGSSTPPATIAAQIPDPSGSGALRFTNGSVLISGNYTYGFNERGAILSSSTFLTTAGIDVTFKTVTYHGNSGGSGADGADGISFFLQDGSKPEGFGAFGGSLAYSCSNTNAPYDGLNGGYIGLGIDEYGNFLNGTNWVAGYNGPNTATGDNTAYGYGYMWNRIGLRGAGNISWAVLNGAYGTNPGNSSLPYYPSALTTSCLNAGGVYSSTGGNCIDVCSAGSTYDATTNLCNKACTGGATYSSSTDTCNSCASVSGTYNTTTQLCTNTNKCLTGTTYYSGTSTCDSCPATAAGYAGGTYSNGTCTNSYPIGDVYSSGFYCPSGDTIVSNSGTYVCYPTGLSYSTGYYCASGQTISGTTCYPTGDSHSGTNYCPTGQTITGTSCYPTGDSTSGTNYCPTGQTITGTSCYPTGDTHSGTYYCSTGNSISGTYCYPTASPANVYGAGYYCPNGDATPTSAGECCPSGYAYSTTLHTCTKSASPNVAAVAATAASAATLMSTATAMSAATPMSAATAATAATAAVTVPAGQTATQITSPTEAAPSTAAPSTGNVDSLYSVQNTCKTGTLYNYSTANAPSSAGPTTTANAANTASVLDYAPIPNAYVQTSFQIANESATTRSAATPIFYHLKITQDGLLSFSYSVSGGAYSYLIQNQSITSSNGPLPASFRVGFAGSDGGATNIHEIMCFKATSSNQSGSSASVNEKESSKVETGTQAYFAYYNPNDWTGTVTANTLTDNGGTITINSIANWDASCELTGTPATGCANTGTTSTSPATPTPTNRVMLTWDTAANTGIPFEWTSLNTAQQAALTVGDSTESAARLSYLRGDRTNEVNSLGVGLYRDRDAILGDIVDSSPAWVGPPTSPYTQAWADRLYPTAPMPENTGTQSYVQYTAAQETRLNVVYVGSNDGFLHGFEAGSFNASGAYVSTGNDGKEVLAYMPGSMLASAALPSATGGCTDITTTSTVVQNIHGATPAISANPAATPPISANPACSTAQLDYSNAQYGHNFFVDGTPGTGDLFYDGQWHTWVVGGLGVGGAAIYALDVTTPSAFSEGNASTLVMGEWTASSIACTNVSSCGSNLGNTFGTPLIRRLHDGNWALIFGNGFGSTTGDAGVFIITIDGSSGKALETYYLSTNTPATNNGIAYVASADLDGDHITDYLYAGDLNGHVWRFDLTSNIETNWAAGAKPLFTTQSGQPITSAPLVISSVVASTTPQVLIEFGTGARTQLTNLGPEQYASGTQSIYGVWDWNMSSWNLLEPSDAYASLTAAQTGLSAPYTVNYANLTQQTLTLNSSDTGATVDGTNVAVCWQGSLTACGAGTFGWYMNLPSADEQIIYGGTYFQGALTINSTVPANNVATSCASTLDTGYTYTINIATGGIFPNVYPTYTYTKNGVLVTANDPNAAGILTGATGSVYVVNTSEGTTNFVYQTVSGVPATQQPTIPNNTKAKRLTWVELR